MSQEKVPPENGPKLTRTHAIIGIVFVILFAWMFIGADHSPASTAGPTSFELAFAREQAQAKADAQAAKGVRMKAEKRVTEILKAPSSAKFGAASVKKTKESAWTVSGTVEAQNSFGVMLRNRYVCGVQLDQPECVLF